MIRPPTTTRKALAPGETAGTANRTKVAIQAAPVAAMAHPSPNTTVALVGDLDTCVDRLRRLWQLDIDRITFALLSGGREVSGYHLDVTDHDQVCAVISEVAAVKGRLDVLVNNAGWSKIEPVAEMSLDTVGFKPTYGTIDDAGGFQAFSPFISVGPLARCVADARCLHSVLSADGARTGDSPVVLGPRRVAWCSKPEGRPIDADVGDVVATAVTQIAACGHDVSPVELDLGGWEEIFGPLVPAEEGERRGHLLRGPYELTRYHGRSLMAAEQLDPGVLTAARSALAQFRERVDRYFCDYDVIVTPATATTAFELGCRPTAIAGEPVARLWGAFPFAVPFNVSGHPAVVLPAGFVDGLPVAIQLVGRHGADTELLSLAEQLEAGLDVRPFARLAPRL